MFKVVDKTAVTIEKTSAIEDILGILSWTNSKTTFRETLSQLKDKCVKTLNPFGNFFEKVRVVMIP